MKDLLHQLYKRLVIHWISTVKGIVYAILLFMYYKKIINTQEWILAAGTILALNKLVEKDGNKIETKEKFQVPDPE